MTDGSIQNTGTLSGISKEEEHRAVYPHWGGRDTGLTREIQTEQPERIQAGLGQGAGSEDRGRVSSQHVKAASITSRPTRLEELQITPGRQSRLPDQGQGQGGACVTSRHPEPGAMAQQPPPTCGAWDPGPTADL